MSEFIIPHAYTVKPEDRNTKKGHRSFVIWFTGLSGSGKSTIANLVEQALFNKGIDVFSLDGDNIRSGINKGLSFSAEDRKENLRRIAEVAKLFVTSGTVTLAAFVSPMIADRAMIKSIVGEDDFIEVFIDTSVEECERRDVKGLYKKARAGEIPNFTGISAPYEPPTQPDIHITTENTSKQEAVAKILAFVASKLALS